MNQATHDLQVGDTCLVVRSTCGNEMKIVMVTSTEPVDETHDVEVMSLGTELNFTVTSLVYEDSQPVHLKSQMLPFNSKNLLKLPDITE